MMPSSLAAEAAAAADSLLVSMGRLEGEGLEGAAAMVTTQLVVLYKQVCEQPLKNK